MPSKTLSVRNQRTIAVDPVISFNFSIIITVDIQFPDSPANAYYQSLLGSSYDWSYKTTPQSGANNRAISWPRGKILGGSSAVNGMYMVRPTKTEVDAWAALVPGGSDKWNWDSLFKGMQDSETFTAPSDDVKKTGNIQFNAVSHGTSGPVHVTYPGLYVPVP